MKRYRIKRLAYQSYLIQKRFLWIFWRDVDIFSTLEAARCHIDWIVLCEEEPELVSQTREMGERLGLAGTNTKSIESKND